MDYEPTERTKIHRKPDRGRYDRATVHAILDEALFAHVGFVVEGQPFVMPMVYGRQGDELYLHGPLASRLLKSSGVPLCVTVTLIDGLVLARSAVHHSMNYRSVVILGQAHEVSEPEEKRAALTAIVDHALANRSAGCRPPSDRELRATRVLALEIAEASAKVRTGGPLDDEADLGLPHWAGVLPWAGRAGSPIPDERHPPRGEVPVGLSDYRR